MKKFKILGNIFTVLALVLSHLTCIIVAYNYANMLCMIEHKGFSAPPDIVFILAIPYYIAIICSIVLAFVFYKKSHQR